jgi:putative transposase
MPRRNRFSTAGYVFHVLNRAVARQTIFSRELDFQAFEKVLQEAGAVVPMRLLNYIIMPNHWHLVLWPEGDEDLPAYMHWLSMTHPQRWHAAHRTSGSGPLYQGRYKSFPMEEDDHLFAVCRYVERNALRANLVSRAELWRWSSLWQLHNQHCDVSLYEWPLPRPSKWLDYVNSTETEAELLALRKSVQRDSPFGSRAWRAIRRSGLV